MIPNVTRGGKAHGVLLYLVGKGKREEHENPHLVAGSPEAVRMGERKLLERSDAVALARFLDEPREQFGTKVTIAERDKETGRVIGMRDAHVWHCSLCCASTNSRRCSPQSNTRGITVRAMRPSICGSPNGRC